MPISLETRPFAGERGAKTNTISVEEHPFHAGGRDPSKSILEGWIGNHPVSFVKKYVAGTIVVENWKRFQRVGIPVVHMMRDIGDGYIIMTDLKADGSELYGQAFYNVLTEKGKRERPRPEIDRLYVELTAPSKISHIENSVNELVDLANGNNIYLPADDPAELVVHPDGSWNLIVLDLQQGEQVDPSRPEAILIPRINKTATKIFLSNLKDIREKLLHKQRS